MLRENRKNQKKKNQSICFILFLCLLCTGCGTKEEITLEPVSLENTEEQQQSDEDEPVQLEKDAQAHTEENQADATTEGTEPKEKEKRSVWVYVCGAVHTPGVYELEKGSRIYQAITMAGGLTQEAASAYVNQAETVDDGQKIYVPKTEEVSATELIQGTYVQNETAGQENGTDSTAPSDSRVNINTADQAGLQTLPGIGEVKALAIIAYREANGGFSSVEEIMQVEGIKEGTFRKIQDLICAQ